MRALRGSDTAGCDAVLWPQPRERTTPRVSPRVNDDIGLVVMYRHRLNCNKCKVWMPGDTVGEGIHGNSMLLTHFFNQ